LKILILRFSSIGDIVLTTPVVRCLKLQLPDVEIHYATKHQYTAILLANPYISKVHCLANSFSDLVNELNAEQFDYIIDLHHNQRTFLLKLRLGVKSFSFNKLNWQKWLLVQFKLNRLPNVSIVDRYLQTLHQLAVKNDNEGLDFFVTEGDVVDLSALPDAFQRGFVAWVIGAKQHTKRFPVNKIINTINLIPNLPIVLFGGPEDKQDGEEIVAALPNSLVYNSCGKYTLAQSASLLQQATLVVTNDTGLMHIAAALKKPIISIWGNTVPEFGMSPYYGRHKIQSHIIEQEGLSCRPCSKIGHKKCPEGHFNCMKSLSELYLANSIESSVVKSS